MRIICLFALILGSLNFVNAQRLIPKVGVVYSTTTADEFVSELKNSVKYKAGYTVGLAYEMPLATIGKGMLHVQPEINFITKSFSVDAAGDISAAEVALHLETDQEYRINYLEFPVLAKYELGSDFMRFNFYTGASVGFALGGKYKSNVDVTYPNGEGDAYSYSSEGDIVFYDSKNNEGNAEFDHNIDVSWQAGAGITINKRISLDVRYGLGLTNVKHYTDSKFRSVQFTVGVPIGL